MTKRKLVFSLVLLSVLAVALVSVVHAITGRESLEGLDGVHVVVEDVNAEEIGLSASVIQTAVELRLRQSRIRVLTESECKKAPGRPFLYVRTGSSSHSKPATYNINLTHYEWVIQTRKPYKLIFGSTWNEGMMGRGDAEHFKSTLLLLVDEYANDYLAANEKPLEVPKTSQPKAE